MAFTLPAENSQVTKDELRRLTGALHDEVRRVLRRCVDADVTFEPIDPLAEDRDAEDPSQASRAWTLGHILVHVTATAEECAALAAELARGVANHGRSRREIPWESMKTIAQCHARLEESHRIVLASFGMWPAQPDHTNTYIPWPNAAPIGAIAQVMLGIRHEAGHLAQMRDVIRQSRRWRWERTLLGRLSLRLRRRAPSTRVAPGASRAQPATEAEPPTPTPGAVATPAPAQTAQPSAPEPAAPPEAPSDAAPGAQLDPPSAAQLDAASDASPDATQPPSGLEPAVLESPQELDHIGAEPARDPE